jgi:transcriptional regulator with XRE-family HTH domain
MSAQIKKTDRVRWNLKFAILLKFGSETKFAEALGISRQQLTHIIVGRNPGYHIRKKASELLGYPESYLFGPESSDVQKYKIGG